MATFPTFESVLIQIAKALDTTRNMSSKTKSNFKHVDMSMDNLSDTMGKILDDIANTLGLDEKAKNDFKSNISADYHMHKAIELDVFSSKAAQKKVVWQYLARIAVPSMARHVVFWQIESKIDEGMPNGDGLFWYLPTTVDSSIESTSLRLPVQKVLDWLIDLIQDSNIAIANNIEEDLRIHNNSGTILRNIYNWQKAKSTPEISSINNTFPDEVKIQFLGCFTPDKNLSRSLQFEQALIFIKNKNLQPSTLQYEIAMKKDELERIINSRCSIKEQKDFVQKLKIRYQDNADCVCDFYAARIASILCT